MTTVRLPADPRSVTQGRHAARDLVVEWGLARLVDDVQLLVAELVANAVRHTSSEVELVLVREDDALRISVCDDNPVMLTGRGGDAHLPETGRGLQLVGALARDWGVEPYGTGKRVWCVLPVGEPQTRDADVLSMSAHRGGQQGAALVEGDPVDARGGSVAR